MKKQSGFTLISVILAIVMLSIGVLSLAKTSAVAISAQSSAGMRTTATTIARAYMETIRRREKVDIVTEPAVMVDDQGVVDPSGFYQRSVYVENIRHNLKKITVTVNYPRTSVPVVLVTMAFVGKI